jgi:hypothetical protein
VGKGAKIAIGCGVVTLLAGIAVVVAVFGAAWWAKGKIQEAAGEQQQIQELHDKANAAHPFTRPEDGVISEDRLEAFLAIRRKVFAVYEKHEDEIEAIGKKRQAGLGDLRTGFNLINEVRLAQAQAQADVGMSDDEYAFMVEQVYKSAWASAVADQTGGKSVSEAASGAMEEAARQMEQTGTAEGVPEEAREQMEEGARRMQAQAAEARAHAQETDVPPQNIALFRKHKDEIQKYAMGGLELLGL